MSNEHNTTSLTVWLTGATSGIGLAVLAELVRQGHRVIATGRNRDRLNEIVAEYGNAVTPLAGDVTSPQDCRYFREQLHAMAPIDWAILNAGTCEYMDVSDFDAELVARVVNTNIVGTARAIEAVLPVLRTSRNRERHPLLAVVGSSAWWFPFTRAEAYGASKAGLAYLAESLRADLAGEGIDVSLISPGFVRTPLTDQNDFSMPFLMEAEDAARIMVRDLTRHRPDIHFPRRFTLMLKLFACLPRSLRDRMAAAMSRNAKESND